MMNRRQFVTGLGGLVAAAYGEGLAGAALVSAGSRRVDPRLHTLASRLSGPLITPADTGYDRARVVYNERYDDIRPLGIARPASVADVQAIVSWAGAEGVHPFARSGGHSYAGYSTGPGLVVDLRSLSGIAYRSSTGTVTVGAGARLIDVEAALAARGRAIPTGSCATVGIAGLAQGGGVGFASRKLGTTSDNVLSFGIVTPDGRHRICDRNTHEDLYWACRGGGGGNFGVVTHFTLRTHHVPNVAYFFADWDWPRAHDVIEAWLAFAPHAPDDLFSVCTLGAAGPSVGVAGQFLGPEPALRRALSPLAQVPGLRLTTGSSSYLDAQLRWAGCLGKTVSECHLAGETPGGTLERALFAGKSDYLARPLSAAGRATIVHWIEQAGASPFGSAALILDSYGGALNRRAPDETAFVHRNALCSAQYLAYWGGAAQRPRALGWLRGFYAAMRPHVSGYAYQNYIDPDLAGWAHAYYGANYPRLQRIKKEIDPGGLFRFRQSIRPA